ncbi:hypothetical protein LDL08_35500 [Nonomuraea glycinis]|uniref:hypothetical protein n=1 Tax=Nonomuraea glycinis TaxID=2047744 RepID=UPI0016656BD6|nr:hypothetical protein [Nonomuraea glycinis]MCA2181481.1 hypothetical protein [Nonomuraea glycinis]
MFHGFTAEELVVLRDLCLGLAANQHRLADHLSVSTKPVALRKLTPAARASSPMLKPCSLPLRRTDHFCQGLLRSPSARIGSSGSSFLAMHADISALMSRPAHPTARSCPSPATPQKPKPPPPS